MPECFFARLGGCEGRLVKAHLIPKQRIKRELRSARILAHVSRLSLEREVDQAVWDPRVWTWMCGGLNYGAEGHHGAFDAKQIVIARDDLPEGVEEYAREYGLEWSLEADYGLPSGFYA